MVKLAYAGVSNVRANIVCVRIVEESDVWTSSSSTFSSEMEDRGGPTWAFVEDLDVVDFLGEIRPRPR